MDLSSNQIRYAEPRPLPEPAVNEARQPLFLFIIQKKSEKVLGGSQPTAFASGPRFSS